MAAMNGSQRNAPNIWDQMSYTPPRGPCSQKNTYLIPCTCLRFMVHPLKAASSFECDGCGHHASFHKMDNQKEEEITRRWKVEEAEKARGEKANGAHQRLLTNGDAVEGLENEGQAPKRRRIADHSTLLDSPSIAASKKWTREQRVVAEHDINRMNLKNPGIPAHFACLLFVKDN